MSGTPQVVSVGQNLYVVAEGTDHAVYDKYWDRAGQQWLPSTTSYEHLGGIAVGEVSTVSGYYTHILDLFVIGTDGELFYKFNFNGAWYTQP